MNQALGYIGCLKVYLSPKPDNKTSEFSYALQAQEYLNEEVICEYGDWQFEGNVGSTSYNSANDTVSLTIYDQLSQLAKPIRSQLFTSKTFADIVGELVVDQDLRFLGECRDINIKLAIQYQESDLEFIRRLCSQIGAQIWCAGGKIFLGSSITTEPKDLIMRRHISEIEISTNLGSEEVRIHTIPYNEGQEGPIQKILNNQECGPIQEKLINIRKESQVTPNYHILVEDNEFNESGIFGHKRLKQNAENRILISGIISEPIFIGTKIKLKEDIENSEFGNGPEMVVVSKLGTEWRLGEGDPVFHFEAISEDGLIADYMQNKYDYKVSTALVEKTNDNLNRVCIRFPWDERSDISPWLRMASSSWGKTNYQYLPPRIGDTVLVMWGGENMEPVVLGSITGGDYVDETDKDIVFSLGDGRQVVFSKDSIILENKEGKSRLEILPDDIKINADSVVIKASRMDIK